jgi:hypothetical protein
MRLITLIVYLGIGAMFHVLFAGSHFDFASAWTWALLLGWPVVLLGWFAMVVIALVAIAIVYEKVRYG